MTTLLNFPSLLSISKGSTKMLCDRESFVPAEVHPADLHEVRLRTLSSRLRSFSLSFEFHLAVILFRLLPFNNQISIIEPVVILQ